MSDFMWYCQRCGNVGFHSEACITATISEDMAAKKAVAAERARITVGLRDLADGFGDVSAAAVLALIEETRHDRQV